MLLNRFEQFVPGQDELGFLFPLRPERRSNFPLPLVPDRSRDAQASPGCFASGLTGIPAVDRHIRYPALLLGQDCEIRPVDQLAEPAQGRVQFQHAGG
jgi:hypothetical protein